MNDFKKEESRLNQELKETEEKKLTIKLPCK